MTATDRPPPLTPPLTLYDRLRLAELLLECPTLTEAEARAELGLSGEGNAGAHATHTLRRQTAVDSD